jgi:hypothetical protein
LRAVSQSSLSSEKLRVVSPPPVDEEASVFSFTNSNSKCPLPSVKVAYRLSAVDTRARTTGACVLALTTVPEMVVFSGSAGWVCANAGCDDLDAAARRRAAKKLVARCVEGLFLLFRRPRIRSHRSALRCMKAVLYLRQCLSLVCVSAQRNARWARNASPSITSEPRV